MDIMQVTLNIDQDDFRRAAQMQLDAMWKVTVRQERLNALVKPVLDAQITEVLQTIDLRPVIRERITAIVTEIVQEAVNGKIRHIARTIAQQEIDKLRAAHVQPEAVRE
jgi:hypothetical protein